MKFRIRVTLIYLMFAIAAGGCDARPTKPMTSIPKPPAAVEDDGPEIDRAAAEASIRPPAPLNQPVASDQASAPVEVENKPVEPIEELVDTSFWLDADAQLPMDYWETQYFNAQRIGMTHYRIEQAGKTELKIRMETNMQLARGERLPRQRIVIETREGLNGGLSRFEETLAGARVSQTEGLIKDNEMKLKSTSAERNNQKQITWPAGSWGPMGIHQILLRKPMQAGEARKAKVFLPQMHQLAEVTLIAGKIENTTSPEGLLTDLLPIDVVMQLSGSGMRVRMWADTLGRIQKTISPEGPNLSSFRISSQAASQLQAEDEIESYVATTLAVDAAPAEIKAAKEVQYKITSDEPDPHVLFSPQTNQTVKPILVYDTLVTVLRPNWEESPPPDAKQFAPSLKERSNSTWLPSDDPQIEQLAKQWSGQATQPVEVAQALLAATYQQMKKLDFAPTIHPVQMVAQSMEGDSTEHAMLLTALLRNRQIAARIASGLRLQEQDGPAKFEYHMWTEAWLNDRWMPMDATTGQLTSCAYLKFIDTSLDDADPYQAVLTVLRRLKHLKVSKE